MLRDITGNWKLIRKINHNCVNLETRKLSPLGDFESHNVVIQLKNENTLNRLYGFKKTYKTIALHIDEKEQFKTRLENALQLLKSK